MAKLDRRMLLEFIQKHPGCSTADIALAFEVPKSRVSTQMVYTYAAVPHLWRQSETKGKTSAYRYFLRKQPRLEEKAEAKPKRLPKVPRDAPPPKEDWEVYAPAPAPAPEPEPVPEPIPKHLLSNGAEASIQQIVDNREVESLLESKEEISPVPLRDAAHQRRIADVTKELALRVAESIIDQTMASIKEQLKDKVQRLIDDPLKYLFDDSLVPAQQAADKIRKLRVCICGLEARERNMIEDKYGSDLDLRFWKKESLHKLQALVVSSDHTISMIRFVGHEVDNVCKSVNVKPIRIPTGINELEATLTDLYVKWQDKNKAS